jgi:hypothetical protein
MTRRTLTLLLVAAGAAGCTPTYRVHVNTFSQFKEPFSPGASIYVATDPNSRNPILAQRIAAKIRSMVEDLGYTAADKAEGAQYRLTFRAGVNTSSYLDYMPVYRPFGGYYGAYGFRRGYGFGYGYSVYEPYVETVYGNWLEMRLYGPGSISKERPPVWIGEAVVGMDEPETRRAVDYLLVGLMEYFGADTRRWVTMTLKENDPRVEGLAEVQ